MDMIIIAVAIFGVLGALGWHLRSGFENRDMKQLAKHLVLGLITSLLAYAFVLEPAGLSDRLIMGASIVSGYFNTEILDILLEKGNKYLKK